MDCADPQRGLPPELVVDGRIATIHLRRPRLANRLEPEDLAVLQSQVEAVDAMPDVLVLRLCAQGRSFCAGFNIHQVAAAGIDVGAAFEALGEALARARPVTIAALQGGVYGGASDIVMACDIRVGTPDAELMVPAARLGLHYYRKGLERFVATLGPGITRRVMLLAERFDAHAMLASGMLDRLVAREELGAAIDALSEDVAGMAPLALLGMKRHIAAIARGELDAAAIQRDIDAANRSEDLREGGLAWQQKRRPRFQGR